jgi:hypothetical protein
VNVVDTVIEELRARSEEKYRKFLDAYYHYELTGEIRPELAEFLERAYTLHHGRP